MITKIIIIGWLICSILSYGMELAYYQRSYALIAKENYSSDVATSFVVSLFGPVSLVTNFFWIKYGSIHGWQGFQWK